MQYECCMGCYPFEAQNEGALIRKILKGTFTPISGPFSTALKQLAASMMTFDVRRRPTAAQLLQTPVVISQVSRGGASDTHLIDMVKLSCHQ
jgi:NIMA (never in mitosis gene a)-related kinase